MGIRLLVALATLIPVMALLAFASSSSVELFTLAAKSDRLANVVRLSSYSSAVIHEMQIERGRTVGMITGDHDASLTAAVAEQRGSVDAAAAEMARFVETSDALPFVPELAQPVRKVLATLERRERFRADVDARRAAVDDVVQFYTPQINALIDLIGTVAAHSPTVEVYRDVSALKALVEAKEHGGLERAFGTALFNEAAIGLVEQERFNAYLTRLTGEALALARFRAEAPARMVAWFDETVTGPAVLQVRDWRKILASITITQAGQGISGQEWFDTATVRLDLIKQVEDRIGEMAHADAVANAAELRSQAWRNIVIYVAAALSCLLLSVIAVRGFATGLASARVSLGRLSIGDIAIRQERRRRDEFGEIEGEIGRLAQSMNQWVTAASRLSAGRLDARFTALSEEDVLGRALEDMRDRLAMILTSAAFQIDELSEGSTTLSHATERFATGSGEQAVAAREITDNIDQMESDLR
ncbi:MAG: nitrate- and nitrite sensing domain-containing protein, partial [Pseudomonadota bacterium]